jgi:asparagine synthase (glutamine-hydrolysing)
MCGICGIFNLDLEPLAHGGRIAAMSERLVHRGPDSSGRFERPFLALAIRRLSIIDLETGDQPLSNETGEVTLVFNGEIYNYRELRTDLEERGHRFRTRSDGEVMAHLYEERGPDFVRELNGMFAVALWDDRARRLVVARDRAGEKPFYYRLDGRTLVFASELKSLFEYPGASRELDREALALYLFYGYVPGPRSIFSGVHRLPAAHRMVLEGGSARLERYWNPADYLRAPEAPPIVSDWEERALAEALRARLREACVSRLVSDVPLGVFLSGGVDSSTLVALMSELSPGNINTFSVAFPHKGFNESPYADQVARRFGATHRVLEAGEPELREALDTLAGHLDEPLGDPAVLPTYLLSRFARQHIKVALSGEGSDELFGGYPTHVGARVAEVYLGLPRFFRRNFVEQLARLVPPSSSAVSAGLFLRRFFAHVERGALERHAIWFAAASPEEADALLAPEWKCGREPSARAIDYLRSVTEGVRFEDAVAGALYTDFRMYLEDNLLVKIDRASMACSLELRTPFLDHRLIEFASALPSELKVRGWTMKYLLKKAVEPWLPREIVHRQKRGFSVPIADWLRGSLRPLVEDTLAEPKLKREGVLNARFVRRLLEEHWSRRADHRKVLWAVLCFELWYERWGPERS